MATTVKRNLTISASLHSNRGEDDEADDDIQNGDDNHNDDNEQGNDDYNADNVEDCDSNYDKPDNLHFSCPQPRCSGRQEDTATSPGEDLNISL